MKNKALLISFALMLFLVLGAVSAVDSGNVSNTEDSNLVSDNVSTLSNQSKLEVSNEDSISETNIVNSHDDNLEDYPDDVALTSYEYSSYEDNDGQVLSSDIDDEVSDKTIISGDEILSVSDDTEILSANTTTFLDVSDTHYSKTATFKVTLKDGDGHAITGQKVSLKVKGITYSATSDGSGVALVKTTALAIGTYDVVLSYGGNSKYNASTTSKKVKVLSSVSGNDITKYYGYISVYSVKYWKDNDALANTEVSLTVHGVTYKKKTDKNGVVEINVNLAPGTYSITTKNPYSNEKSSNKVISKKDTTTLKHSTKSTYLVPNKKYSYTVTLKSSHNALIKDMKVTFTFKNKKVTVKTNSKGQATLTIPALSKGTYAISYKFVTNNLYYGSSESGKIYVKNPTVKLSSSTLKMKYKDGSKFAVTLKDSNNKVLANKTIKFTLNGKSYTQKTNEKGVAYLAVGNLKPGTYTVKYQSDSLGSKYYGTGSNKIVISKLSASLSAGNLVMNHNDGSYYKVTVKDKSGNALKGIGVKVTINGVTYNKKTDSNGTVSIKIGLAVGYYTVKSVVSDSYYSSSTANKHITVNGTKFVAKNIYVKIKSKVSYSITLLDCKKKPIKNANVVVTIDKKTYNLKSNSKGVVKVSLGTLSAGTHKIKYTHGSYSGTSKINVVSKVTIAQLISASKTVKKYIEKNKKLPSSVKIGKLKYSTAEYLYLVSKAIKNLKSGSKSSIDIKSVKAPSKAGKAANLGNLKNYLSVAKSVIKYADSKGKMPNSVSSKVGTIGYKGIVYAFSRVMTFYGSAKVLPSYVSILSLSHSTSYNSVLNSKNTIKNLAAYLAASTNCQVNNAKIKSLVKKLTKGLTSDSAKAKAIFNYVRDTVSYSFYYDTKYGAVGTLNAKTGNCVDHSHLLVAMYRAAKLPARYAHGTCTFSSGGTYGHVWTQVLIGDTWVVSDATSSRNSFGKVVNWNSNSYSLHGYYSSLSF